MSKSALFNWVSEILGQKFAWGKTDCATITRQGLEKLGWHGQTCLSVRQWNSRREAWRTHKQYGGVSGFLKQHGWRQIPAAYAQTGDIIVLRTHPMETTCLVINDVILVIDPVSGVGYRKIRDIQEFFICFRRI